MEKLKPINYKGLLVMPGSDAYKLLSSGKPEDAAKAKRLIEYTRKAGDVFYNAEAIAELRKQYSDVI